MASSLPVLNKPLDVAEAFAAAWNNHDADSLAALFVEDADFVNVVGLWWHDRGSIRKAHAYGFEKIFTSSHMTLRRTSVRQLSADIAVVHAAWLMTGQESHSGIEAERRRGVMSFTVQRQEDGAWRAVSAHNTDCINGAETHIATGGALTPAHYGHTTEQ